MRKLIILFISLALILTSTPVYAEEPDGFMVSLDAVVARPLGLAVTVVGAAFFVVALPFAATSGSVNKTADALVGEPFRFTFHRPLGDFSEKSYSETTKQVKEYQQSGTETKAEDKKTQQ